MLTRVDVRVESRGRRRDLVCFEWTIGTDAERELDRVEVRSHAEMTAAWQRFRDLYGAA